MTAQLQYLSLITARRRRRVTFSSRSFGSPRFRKKVGYGRFVSARFSQRRIPINVALHQKTPRPPFPERPVRATHRGWVEIARRVPNRHGGRRELRDEGEPRGEDFDCEQQVSVMYIAMYGQTVTS